METSLKHARDVTNTSLKHPQNTSKRTTKQHQNNTETSPKKDRDKTETRPRHDRDITKTTPRHHRDKTKTRPRQDRDTTETRPTAWIFQYWSFLRRHTGHSYTGLPKGAQDTNSNRNLRFCLETRSKCSSMFITKRSKHHHQRKKQHCNINETTPSHHPLIIKTSQHHQHTSPRFHRNMPETSPTHQKTWSIIRGHTSHSYTGLPKGAQYTNSNWNLRICSETRSKCSSMFIRKSKHHHQRNKNSTATSTTQHQAITHSSS